jgi:hypothetical protein
MKSGKFDRLCSHKEIRTVNMIGICPATQAYQNPYCKAEEKKSHNNLDILKIIGNCWRRQDKTKQSNATVACFVHQSDLAVKIWQDQARPSSTAFGTF